MSYSESERGPGTVQLQRGQIICITGVVYMTCTLYSTSSEVSLSIKGKEQLGKCYKEKKNPQGEKKKSIEGQ